MIYVPIDVKYPINVKKQVTVQYGLTSNFPEILFELHDDKMYFDLGDNCMVSAVVQNTRNETTLFTGSLQVKNPHRGQIVCRPVYRDFTMTGINTLTFMVLSDDIRFSFQTTIFVEPTFILKPNVGQQPDYETVVFSIQIKPTDFEDGEYTIRNASITSDSEVHISLPDNVSVQEYDAIAFANFVVEEQKNGYIKLKILGKTPSIPIKFKITVKNEV